MFEFLGCATEQCTFYSSAVNIWPRILQQRSSLQEQETDLTGMVEELMAENVFLREATQQLEEELNQSDLQTYGAEQQNGRYTDFVVTTTSGK